MRGDDIYEQGLVDSVAETADDLLSDYLKTVIEEHPHHKHDSKRRFLEEILPHTLRYLDNFKRKHSREYGYVVGGKLTYADLAVYNVLEQLVVSGTVDPKLLLQFNYTAELRKRMLSHGSLSRYFKSRPHTQI
ncbi:glutathione S-transferase 3-like [Paramacrobiotus metropolitanus]|uniref:glutathione S-transferase 3-like n=1 Tax=Paramacrobiotus metropolitanus TaxID=2943436 RepID=UPI002445BAEC|nr:glutathione S-transferase 3-like [Paramacrobiotus metropolitanus]